MLSGGKFDFSECSYGALLNNLIKFTVLPTRVKMPPFKKTHRLLDQQNLKSEVKSSKPFKAQRVVSFKIYEQEQKSRLTTLYPFLTQEQICLKIKDRWNRMENDLKQNYTKAVLCGTPSSRKSDCILSSRSPHFKTHMKRDNSPKVTRSEPALSSTEKVSDWLKNSKEATSKKGLGMKRYNSTSYAVPLDVPEVIDTTPNNKQTGILSSSKKKDVKKPTRRRSRVSFSPSTKQQEKKINTPNKEQLPKERSLSDSNTKTCLEAQFTNINDVFNTENIPMKKKSKNMPREEENQTEEPKRKHLVRGDPIYKDIVFDEPIEDELFTTPEMAKVPLQEICKNSKAPKKRKSTKRASFESQGNQSSETAKKMRSNSEKKKVDAEQNRGNTNNNNSDVFGKKAWAASTYSKSSRKFTPNKRMDTESESKTFSAERKMKTEGVFVRDKRGLLVGPIGCDFDDLDDNCESDVNEVELEGNLDIIEPSQTSKCSTMVKKAVKPTKEATKKKEKVVKPLKKATKKGKDLSCRNRIKGVPKQGVLDSYENDFDDCVETTIRNKRGLLVGPMKFGFEDNGDESDEVFSEASEEIDDIIEPSPPSRRSSKKIESEPQKSAPVEKRRSSSRQKREESCNKPKQISKRKQLIESPEGEKTPSKCSSGDLNEYEFDYSKPSLVSLCKDFSLDKAVSPIVSEAGDSNMSGSLAGEDSSPVVTRRGNPTLMKVLMKMRQITSPNILDLDEEQSRSPKLLSPTLSGITELSSLSAESAFAKEKKESPRSKPKRKSKHQKTCDVEEPVIEADKPRNSYCYSSQRQSKKGNALCSMFDDLTPPETKKKSGRRLVTSNRERRSNNFDDMFEEKDIFQ